MNRVFVMGNGESRLKYDLAEIHQFGKMYGCNAVYRDYAPDALICVDDRMMHQVYWSGYAIDNVCYFRDWHRMPAEAYDTLVQPQTLYDDPTKDIDNKVYVNPRDGRSEFVIHGQQVDRVADFKTHIKETMAVAKILRDEDWEMLTGDKASGLWITWVADEDKVTDTKFLPGGSDYGFNAGSLATLIACVVDEPDEIYLVGMDLYSNTDSVNNVYKGTDGYLASGGHAIPPTTWIKQFQLIFDKFSHIQFFKINPDTFSEEDKVSRVIEEWKDMPNLAYLTYAEMFGKLVP